MTDPVKAANLATDIIELLPNGIDKGTALLALKIATLSFTEMLRQQVSDTERFDSLLRQLDIEMNDIMEMAKQG